MKKTYIKPSTEVVIPKYPEFMQGLIIPISGGTTPEERDAKQMPFGDNSLDESGSTDHIKWPSHKLWED